jgi:hypothetical protein
VINVSTRQSGGVCVWFKVNNRQTGVVDIVFEYSNVDNDSDVKPFLSYVHGTDGTYGMMFFDNTEFAEESTSFNITSQILYDIYEVPIDNGVILVCYPHSLRND